MRTRKPRVIKSGCCLECNRPLKDPVSMQRGYGPVCWKNIGGVDAPAVSASIPTSLFSSRQTVPADQLPPAHVDTIYNYEGYGRCVCHCRLRVWFEFAPEDTEGPGRTIAIVTELDSNPGTSVTNMAEYLWASIVREYMLDDAEMYEHYTSPEAHFNRVIFDSGIEPTYNPQHGERLRFGKPTWRGNYSTGEMIERIERLTKSGKAVAA